MEELPVCIERWVRDFVPDTRRHSLKHMRRFTETTGLEPSKFLDFAKTHDSVEVYDTIRKVRDSFDGSVAVNFENSMRSFLKHNGVTNLPTSKNTYSPESWHRGYKREEAKRVIGFLKKKHHKLFSYIAVESGLRAQAILDIRYRHIKEDFEAGIVPCAIRFEPKFYNRTKSAGFTFLGKRSVELLREMINDKLVGHYEAKDSEDQKDATRRGTLKQLWVPGLKDDSPIVGVTYPSIQHALYLAREEAGIPDEVQVNHGFRKYFEDALDRAGLDANRKAILEGHFGGTRAKHYSSREWDQLREDYNKAYSFIDLDGMDPDTVTKLADWQKDRLDLLEKIQQLTMKVDLTSGLIDELMDPEVQGFLKKRREERAAAEK